MRSWRGFLDGRRAVQLVALLLAVAAAAYLLGVPAYGHVSTAVSSDGGTVTRYGSASLVEVNGGWVVGLLLGPVALVAAHALWRGRHRTAAIVACTALLLGFCVAGMLSVGLFFLPAAIASGLSLLAPARPAAPAHPRTPHPA